MYVPGPSIRNLMKINSLQTANTFLKQFTHFGHGFHCLFMSCKLDVCFAGCTTTVIIQETYIYWNHWPEELGTENYRSYVTGTHCKMKSVSSNSECPRCEDPTPVSEEAGLLGYDAMLLAEQFLTFQTNTVRSYVTAKQSEKNAFSL
jgi:uncharacterized paraquat-inducible protein A